jgi:hypothetical protein
MRNDSVYLLAVNPCNTYIRSLDEIQFNFCSSNRLYSVPASPHFLKSPAPSTLGLEPL